jgi:hypothetical protein
MTNPTTLLSTFDGSLAYTDAGAGGVWTGVDPIRYDDGLWIETSTTNIQPNPTAETNTDGYLAWNNATFARVTSDAIAPFAFEVTATTAGEAGMRAGIDGLFAASQGDVMTLSVLARSDDVTTMRLRMTWLDGGFGDLTTHTSGALAVSSTAARVSYTLSAAPATTAFGQVFLYLPTASGHDTGDKLYLAQIQTEEKAFATSYADDVLGTGYGGTPGAYTRAASSVSVTTASPGSVACWYSEDGGTKTFVYRSTMGAIGTYGSVAYGGGDLSLATSRSLIVGPFAAFDRELTAGEQANLAATENWSLTTVLGGNPYARIRSQFELRPY